MTQRNSAYWAWRNRQWGQVRGQASSGCSGVQLGEEHVTTWLKEGLLVVDIVQHWTGSHSQWCPSIARRPKLSDVRHRSRHPTCDSALRPGGTPAAEQLQAEGLREGRCCGSQALNPGGEHYLWHTGNVSALTSTQEVLAQQYAHFFHPHPLPPQHLLCAKKS